MRTLKTLLPLLGLAAACFFHSCSKSTSTVTKTVTDTLTVTDTVAPILPNYADSIKKGEWAYFNFDNNTTDQTGNNHGITLENGAVLDTDIWGNPNAALGFNGTNSYAVIDSGINFPEGDFSVSFLMLSRNLSGRIFQKADYNNGYGATWGFEFDNSLALAYNNLAFYVDSATDVCNETTQSGNSEYMYLSQEITTYSWYYVTCLYTKGNEKVYLNGQLADSNYIGSAATLTNCSNSPIYFGMWWLSDIRPFYGVLDEIRIHTRALTLPEIKYLANDALTQP